MMLSRKWLALVAWVFLPLAAAAQQDPAASPDHAKVQLGSLAYESVFDHYHTLGEQSATPDLAWRAANDDMARLGGHAGHMKDKPEQPAAAPNARKNAPVQDESATRGAHKYGTRP